MSPLRVVFMGTPAFAVPALQALLSATQTYQIVAVYTQPPRPKNRGYQVTKSPIHEVAETLGIPVYTPNSLKSKDAQELFKSHRADVAIVAAYGLILPKAILDIPRLGCVNIHGSLLPRWRGAAPIHRAMLAGDHETGITIMLMDEGLDTGDMLDCAKYPLSPNDSFQKVHDDLSQIGAKLLLKTLHLYACGEIHSKKQPEDGVTYAHKLKREDGHLSWTMSVCAILRQVKALNPWPGTYSYYKHQLLKIKDVSIVSYQTKDAPGTILEGGCIACLDGVISLDVLQKEGGKTLPKWDFLNGFSFIPGEILR